MSSIRVADRYTLDREIGRGGSGAVWLAHDDVLGRSVAIKRIGLPPGAASYDVARAEREARISARVNHANVVSVFDFVDDGEHTWLVTEYVEGTTLAQLIRDRGRLSPDEAAPILGQVAEALAAAHRLSIVHRDVKPSNILIALDGTAKLSDFGIARATADASLTQTGLVTGSPAYLAPEVATGASATAASDVWSFGTTVFHALAGHPPYDVAGDGNAVLATLYRVAHDPPPRLATAGWLTPVLERTMQPDPARRPTMDQVLALLRDGPQASPELDTQVMPAVAPAPAARAGAPRSSRTVLAALAAAAVVGVVGIVLLVSSGDDQPTGAGAGASTRTSDTDAAGATDEPPLPSVAELETFATSYVETAAGDPDAGFAMLTPAYQERSPRYADFWGSVSNPEMLDIEADPDGMTVTYTYRYDLAGSGRQTERITLFLVRDGDRLLIDDALNSG